MSKTVSDQLRQAIETCGKTRYRISQETGIAASILSRFLDGQRGLSDKTIDRLAKYFRLELRDKR